MDWFGKSFIISECCCDKWHTMLSSPADSSDFTVFTGDGSGEIVHGRVFPALSALIAELFEVSCFGVEKRGFLLSVTDGWVGVSGSTEK